MKRKDAPVAAVPERKKQDLSGPAPEFFSPFGGYFLNFLLIPISPSRPEPSNHTAPGMGTGLSVSVMVVESEVMAHSPS